MPTLGFLKKKKTKDLPPGGSSQPTSPISPTVSNTNTGFESLTPTASVQSTTAPTSKSAEPKSTTVVSGAPLQKTISTVVSPPQNDGAAQSNETEMAPLAVSNGGETKDEDVARTTKGKYTLDDFEIQRTLGTGSFGRVHLVQSKHNQRFYAVKVLKKLQVVRMKQVEHTNDERRMLQAVKHPFLITLWGTFQDSKNLYMVMDFVEGGELFSLLRKSQVSSLTTCCGVRLTMK